MAEVAAPVEQLGLADAADAIALWQDNGLTRPWNAPQADFTRAVEGPASAVLGIRDGGALVGTVMVGHDGHRGWVYYLAVELGRHRQGLGARLMRAAEAWIVDHGGVKLQLMVRADNEAASGFYTAIGYEQQAVTVLGRRLAEG
ncbi:GNAT family acetyltransferase [Agrococcus sp. KRD186]|uniref:GNAT family acetyltransferase n=1 Tax=Agrococcus sp. KRD186 TaxID=2729730 RepID=UPI0019CF85E1